MCVHCVGNGCVWVEDILEVIEVVDVVSARDEVCVAVNAVVYTLHESFVSLRSRYYDYMVCLWMPDHLGGRIDGHGMSVDDGSRGRVFYSSHLSS